MFFTHLLFLSSYTFYLFIFWRKYLKVYFRSNIYFFFILTHFIRAQKIWGGGWRISGGLGPPGPPPRATPLNCHGLHFMPDDLLCWRNARNFSNDFPPENKRYKSKLKLASVKGRLCCYFMLWAKFVAWCRPTWFEVYFTFHKLVQSSWRVFTNNMPYKAC